MKVVFWGQAHGQCATSSNMLATAMMNDLIYQNKSILLQTEFAMNELEVPLLTENARQQVKDYRLGVDRLIQGIRAGMNARQLLMSSCISLSRQCIDFLPGTNYKYRDLYEEEIKETIKDILTIAEVCYEFVFVDVSTGMNEFTKIVWEQADILVVNLCQNKRVLNDFFTNYPIDNQKTIYLIGNYDSDSECNLKYILHKYKNIKKDSLFYVPYNTSFRDAASRAGLTEFFLQNIGCEPDDDNYDFMEALKKITYQLHRRSEDGVKKPRAATQRRAVLGGVTSDY